MTHSLLAAFTHHVWILHRPGHPFVFLLLLGVILLLVAAVVTLVVLHFGKK